MKNVIDRHEKNQGMNWIRPEKRLAIYLRDGLAGARKALLEYVSPGPIYWRKE